MEKLDEAKLAANLILDTAERIAHHCSTMWQCRPLLQQMLQNIIDRARQLRNTLSQMSLPQMQPTIEGTLVVPAISLPTRLSSQALTQFSDSLLSALKEAASDAVEEMRNLLLLEKTSSHTTRHRVGELSAQLHFLEKIGQRVQEEFERRNHMPTSFTVDEYAHAKNLLNFMKKTPSGRKGRIQYRSSAAGKKVKF